MPREGKAGPACSPLRQSSCLPPTSGCDKSSPSSCPSWRTSPPAPKEPPRPRLGSNACSPASSNADSKPPPSKRTASSTPATPSGSLRSRSPRPGPRRLRRKDLASHQPAHPRPHRGPQRKPAPAPPPRENRRPRRQAPGRAPASRTSPSAWGSPSAAASPSCSMAMRGLEPATPWSVFFTGQRKHRGEREDFAFEIPTLCPAAGVLAAWTRLQVMLGDQGLDPQEINNRYGHEVNAGRRPPLPRPGPPSLAPPTQGKSGPPGGSPRPPAPRRRPLPPPLPSCVCDHRGPLVLPSQGQSPRLQSRDPGPPPDPRIQRGHPAPRLHRQPPLRRLPDRRRLRRKPRRPTGHQTGKTAGAGGPPRVPGAATHAA